VAARGPRKIGDFLGWETSLLLDHFAFSRISTTRQRFNFEIARVSWIRTRSPTPHWFCSS
jgi:hypothetical protein